MQTLFETRESAWGLLKIRIARHRVLTIAGIVLFGLVFVVWNGYQKFQYAQSPDPSFDTSVQHPAYLREHPRVLFDAGHWNFHTPAGNYKPFADLIRHDGYEVETGTRPFSADLLHPYQVLVIANALGPKGVLAMLLNLVGYHRALQWQMNAFGAAERTAVRDWVADGGSLLLISDHEPTGNAAKLLSQEFGVNMSNWGVDDEQHFDPDAYTWLVFSRENGLLLPHPVTDGRGPAERVYKVVTFTGQSLRGPPGSTSFLKLADSAREYPFMQSTYKEGRSAAGRAQGVALEFGKGRVVVLGEAAMLSAQVFRAPGREIRLGMEYPGCDNRQLALNIMHWLTRLGSSQWLLH